MYYVQQFLVMAVHDNASSKEQVVELCDINGNRHGATRRNWGGWCKLAKGDVVGVLAEVNVPQGIETTHWEAAGFEKIIFIKGIANEVMIAQVKIACDAVNKTMVSG